MYPKILIQYVTVVNNCDTKKLLFYNQVLFNPHCLLQTDPVCLVILMPNVSKGLFKLNVSDSVYDLTVVPFVIRRSSTCTLPVA